MNNLLKHKKGFIFKLVWPNIEFSVKMFDEHSCLLIKKFKKNSLQIKTTSRPTPIHFRIFHRLTELLDEESNDVMDSTIERNAHTPQLLWFIRTCGCINDSKTMTLHSRCRGVVTRMVRSGVKRRRQLSNPTRSNLTTPQKKFN